MLHRNLRVERVLGAWRKDPATYFAALPSELIWLISLWTTPDVFQREMRVEKWAQFQNNHKYSSYHRVFPLTDTTMIVDSMFEVNHLDAVNPPRRLAERWTEGRLASESPGTLWQRNDEKFIHWDPIHNKILAEISLPEELASYGCLDKTAFGYAGCFRWRVFLYDEAFQVIDELPPFTDLFPPAFNNFAVHPKGQVATLTMDNDYYRIFLPLQQHQPELLWRCPDDIEEVFFFSYTDDFHEFYSILKNTVRYHVPPEKSNEKKEWVIAMKFDFPEDFQMTDLKILTNGQLIVIGEELTTKQVIIFKIY